MGVKDCYSVCILPDHKIRTLDGLMHLSDLHVCSKHFVGAGDAIISSLRGGLLAVLLEERLSETGLCSGFRVAPGSEEVMRSPRVGQLAPDSEAVAPDDTGGLLR